MKWRAVAVSLGSILAVLAGSHLLGESPVDFERDVQPILQEKCLSCHTPDAAQSGLVMESVEAMLEGGEKAGPSILAGDSAGSPLVRHLRGELEPQMPVGGDPLPEAQIALIAAWIDQMAPAAAPDGAAQTAGQSASPHDFETDIKPLLEQNCLACHSSQTHQSGLVVETETALLKGGAIQGAAILAGNSQESPLIQRLRGTRAPRMPMNGQPLAEEQIQRIARWIDQLDPARMAEALRRNAKTPAWPWTPVTQPQVPAVKHKEWVRNPIDAFVLAKLEERRLDPAPAVSPRGLLRRLYFSLDRSSTHAGGHEALPGRSLSGGLQAGGGKAAGRFPVRRTLGPALAGPGPLFRHPRRRHRRPSNPFVAIPGLRHPGLQPGPPL